MDTEADPFPQLREAVSVMAGFGRPWVVAGGWAIDLFLGRIRRAHKDVDIAIFREDQLELRRYLAGWRLETAHAGVLTPWGEEEYLELPLHEIWAWKPGAKRDDGQPDLEFLLNERVGGEWR